jgi:hypothetical protein
MAKDEMDNAKTNYYGNLDTIYHHIAAVCVESGDVAGAKAFVATFPSPLAKVMAYQSIAEAQAKAGDVAAAHEALALAQTVAAGIHDTSAKIIPDGTIRTAYAAIAQIQAETGDAAGAKATLTRLQEVVRKDAAGQSQEVANLASDSVFSAQLFVCLEIAANEAKAGKSLEARRNIAAARAAAAQMNSQDLKVYGCLAIGEKQRDIGDLPGMRETMATAGTAAARIRFKGVNEDSNNINKVWAYCAIMTAQAKAGDAAGAHKTLQMILAIIPAFTPGHSGYKSWAYCAIARSQAASGNIAEAKATAAQIQSEDDKARAYCDIVVAQAASGDTAGAIEYCTQVLTDPRKRCKCLTDAAMSLCGSKAK